METSNSQKDLIFLKKEEGRKYHLGPMTAIFKADEKETDSQYSVSEWWLEPNSEGPGAHSHDNYDEIFYVIEGTISFFIDDKWEDAAEGTFIRIPTNMLHTFANRTNKKAGMLNFKIPGGFERNLPSMEEWFMDKE